MRTKLLDWRMDEMAARERIVDGLRTLNLGARITRRICETELGYTTFETRAVLSVLGLILTTEAMTSADPRVNDRILKLREWRSRRARSEKVPAYRVLTNRALMTLASECPKTSDSLRELKGIGPKNVATYGTELLELLNRETRLAPV